MSLNLNRYGTLARIACATPIPRDGRPTSEIDERRGAVLHAKTETIDRVWSCVGSTNLDWRSFLHNDEIDAAILGREFAGQMVAGGRERLRGKIQATHGITRQANEKRLAEWITRQHEIDPIHKRWLRAVANGCVR